MSTQETTIEQIEENYDLIYGDKYDFSNRGKLEAINFIIQVKKEEASLKNYRQSFYTDYKCFIKYCIQVADSAEFGYDRLQIDSFLRLINNIDPKMRESLVLYFIRKLETSAFLDEIKYLKKKYYEIVVKNSFRNIRKPINIVRFFAYAPLINIYTLFTTFFLIATIAVVVPLNAPIEFMEILSFEIKYDYFSNNKLLNHIINILSSLVGIDTDFEIVGKNVVTQTALIISKILVFLIITNILLRKINDYIILKK